MKAERPNFRSPLIKLSEFLFIFRKFNTYSKNIISARPGFLLLCPFLKIVSTAKPASQAPHWNLDGVWVLYLSIMVERGRRRIYATWRAHTCGLEDKKKCFLTQWNVCSRLYTSADTGLFCLPTSCKVTSWLVSGKLLYFRASSGSRLNVPTTLISDHGCSLSIDSRSSNESNLFFTCPKTCLP